ncbi:MAG: hypothetical protein WAK48_19180 [Candidatus Acidiferrum sp.]|jgi:hypothetical protein
MQRRTSALFAAFLLSLLPSASPAQDQKDQKGAGITMAADADAKDIGLPLYPGARRHKGKDSDSPGINFDVWGGGSGVKLAVLKLESDDSPEKIADYYKKKLSKYGKVLDCSHPTDNATDNSDKDDDNKPLTCGSDKPEKNGLLFKSGTKSDQHLVSIQPDPANHGSQFQLVHVAHWQK